MKKCLFMIFLLTSLFQLYAQSFSIDQCFRIKTQNASSEVVKINDQIGIRINDSYEIKSLKDFKLNNNGWYSSNFCGVQMCAIFGGSYFAFYAEDSSVKDSFPRTNDFDTYVKNNIQPWMSSPEDINKNWFGGIVPKISSIDVFDILEETIGGKQFRYDTYDMIHYYSCEPESGIGVFRLNAKPWATSKNPIGQKIKVYFDSPEKVITILNGYVNPEKKHLYKANRRLKKIKITSPESDFEITENLEDVVHFHEIVLPESCSEILIEIKDIYEGDKYKDLCIQFIGSWEVFEDIDPNDNLEKRISYNGKKKKYIPSN